MPTIKTPAPDRLYTSLSRFNFYFLVAFALFTVIFDSGNVITRERVYQEWMLSAVLFVVFALFWVAVKKPFSKNYIFGSLVACVIAELALAGFMTYWERGMASTSTVLYILPIATMGLARSRTYTVGVSLVAAATYMGATTKYFYDFFNEGYRVQLYGELFFYSAVFLICGCIIASLAHAAKK